MTTIHDVLNGTELHGHVFASMEPSLTRLLITPRTLLRFRNDLIRLFLSAGLLPRLLAVMNAALKDLADSTVATALLSAQILCLVSQSDKVVSTPSAHGSSHQLQQPPLDRATACEQSGQRGAEHDGDHSCVWRTPRQMRVRQLVCRTGADRSAGTAMLTFHYCSVTAAQCENILFCMLKCVKNLSSQVCVFPVCPSSYR